MSRLLFLLGGLLYFLQPSLAGDHAVFVNLGWSKDYSHFSFGQYGIEDGSGFPYADIFIVHVAENRFVPGGVLRKRIERDDTDLTGLNVLLNLRLEIDSLFQSYQIDELNSGLLLASFSNQHDNALVWKCRSSEFRLECMQKSLGTFEDFTVKSAFHLELYRDGLLLKRIGNSNRFRDGALEYKMSKVVSDSACQSIVVVVEKKMVGFEGPSVRYMVETVRLD